LYPYFDGFAMSAPAAGSYASSPTDRFKLMPRLTQGVLAVRHVFKLDRELHTCAWCGEPFQLDDEIMEDVYLQQGDSACKLVVGAQSQVFRRAKSVMFHANNTDCASNMAQQAHIETYRRVTKPKRSKPITDLVLYEKFKWCRKWITWHDQYTLSAAKDSVELGLSSQRPNLVVAESTANRGITPQSFVLRINKNHVLGHTIEDVKVPMDLVFSAATLRSLFARVYVYDVSYRGNAQPLALLGDAFQTLCNSFKMDTTVYAHVIPPASNNYRNTHDSTVRLRLIVRMEPVASVLDMFRDEVMHEPLSWYTLSNLVASAKVHDSGSSGMSDSESESAWGPMCADIADSFAIEEQAVSRVLDVAEVEHGLAPPFRSMSRIVIKAIDSTSTSIQFQSNCYCAGQWEPAGTHVDKNALERCYVFCDAVDPDHEQPFYCYEGRLSQPIPVCVASNKNNQLHDEMEECGLRLVDMQSPMRLLVPSSSRLM
jgi:hypothetical protein